MRYLVPAGLIYLAICAGLIIAMFLTAIDPPVCTPSRFPAITHGDRL